MTARTTWTTALSGALVLILSACSGSSAGSAAPPSVGLSSGAATVAPSTPPSVAPSLTIPSFDLPNDDKGLEALLPDKICGAKARKLSFSGDRFTSMADENFTATLAALGKSAKDVSFAVAGDPSGGDCSTTAGVFRVKGADPSKLREVFLAEAVKGGGTQTQGNVGGKDVYINASSSGDTKDYAYFVGDAVFFVAAKDDAAAALVLQAMP